MVEDRKNLFVNQLLIPVEECGLKQISIVVHLDPQNDKAFLMGMDKQSKPRAFSYYAVLGWLIDEKISIGKFKESEYWKKPEQYVSKIELEKRDQKYQIIKPLIERLPQFLSSNNYGKGLVESCVITAKQFGYKGTRWQITQWLYRYLQCGQNVNGLLRKPGTGKSLNKKYSKKTGPKRDEGNSCNGRMRNEEDERHFIATLKAHVFCPHPKPLTEAFVEYQNKYVSDPIVNPYSGAIEGYELWSDTELLSEDQFTYFAKQYMTANADKLRTAQHLVDEFNKNERALSGKVHEVFGEGPGSHYQIDETPLAIELVDEFDRDRRLGKPTCYSVIDMFSRAWVALMLTFAKASAHTAREVLFVAFRNKQEFSHEIGVTLNEAWPFEGKCTGIIVDNAEFASSLTDAFSQDAKVEVSFNKEGNSQEKGLVERRHKSLEDFLYGRVPGVERKYVKDYLKRSLRKQAILNIRELYQILIDYITRYNNHYPLKTLPFTKEMREDGVVRTPLDVWHWGLTHRAGNLIHLDDDSELFMQLLETGEVTVKRNGLFLQGKFIRSFKERRTSTGLLYDCAWSYSTGVQERQQGQTYPCKFMRYSMSRIWIVTEIGYQEATLSALDSAYAWWNAESIQADKIAQSKAESEQRKIYQHKQNKTRASTKAMIEGAREEQRSITAHAANNQDISLNRDIAIKEEIQESKTRLDKLSASHSTKAYDVEEQPSEHSPSSDESQSNHIANVFAAKSRKNRARRK